MDPNLIDLATIGEIKEETPDPPSSSMSCSSSKEKEAFRSQQSLGLITQKFLNLRQKNEILNLNEVARELNISKRRVYDVINVLEGLGYVQKKEKNNIQWTADTEKTEVHDQLEAEVEVLRQQEKILEQLLRDAQSSIKFHFEDPILRPYNYIRKDDIRNTTDPTQKSIIVKSDVDTSSRFDVTLSEPSENGSKFEMIVRNKNGVKSHAYLFTNDNFKNSEEKMKSESPKKKKFRPPVAENDRTLASISTESNIIKIEEDDSDTEDLETFVLPTSSSDSTDSRYIPETPGRGLFFSPLKLIDPTCILPNFNDDSPTSSSCRQNSSEYIPVSSPTSSKPPGYENFGLNDEEPTSILDLFKDSL